MKLNKLAEFPKIDGAFGFTGSQAPTMLFDGTTILKLFFTTRDSKNRGDLGYFSLYRPNSMSNLEDNVAKASTHILGNTLGKPGTFNSSGSMVSQCFSNHMYITGWNLGADEHSTFKNSIGRLDFDWGFRLSNSEVLIDRDKNFPLGCSMPFYDDDDLYLMRFTGWLNKKALYDIVVYNESTKKLDTILTGRYCYARPVIHKSGKNRQLWYCYRDFDKKNYKAGCLELINGTWFPVPVEAEDKIVAYPFPFTIDNKTYVLYNNDKSLGGAIQLAEVVE